jgi:hypothetical protein
MNHENRVTYSLFSLIFQLTVIIRFAFSHPWNTVADAAWRKYPNPINRAVTAVDVVKQEVNDGVLMSQRVLQSRFSVPGWVSKVHLSNQMDNNECCS